MAQQPFTICRNLAGATEQILKAENRFSDMRLYSDNYFATSQDLLK
jgi:hypothetical protein